MDSTGGCPLPKDGRGEHAPRNHSHKTESISSRPQGARLRNRAPTEMVQGESENAIVGRLGNVGPCRRAVAPPGRAPIDAFPASHRVGCGAADRDLPAPRHTESLPLVQGCGMIQFSGRSIHGQSQNCNSPLLSCHRIHSGGRISLAIQYADHSQRDARSRSEVRCQYSSTSGPARRFADLTIPRCGKACS